MPRYRVTLSDGRAVTVEADAPPSEADVLGALGDSPAPKPFPKTTYADEPTTYQEGFKKSLMDTATRTGGGMLRGAAQMLNPATYLSASGDEHERMRAEATGERTPSSDYGMGEARALGESLTTPEGGGEAIGSLATGLLGPRLMTKIPAARQAVGGAIERAGATMDSQGPMAGLTRNAVGSTVGAVLGGPVGAAVGGAAGVAAPAMVRGAGRLIRGRVPPVPDVVPPDVVAPPAIEPPAAIQHGPGSTSPPVAEPGPMLGPSPKPKLSAPETAAMLREQYGSEKAGRMLYGKGKGGHIPPAERQAAIKRLAPGESALPASAARQMDTALEGASPADAYAYAQQAPNARAQAYFGERLTSLPKAAQEAEIRRILTEMMGAK